ncbi:MAG: hypothetical protein WAV25_02580 [Minisyncoccia bacterium]
MKREGKKNTLKVVTVIPISRSLLRSSLSYFTKDDVLVGSFVRISIRNKLGLGLVTNISDARSVKSDLKSSSFALKKLSKGGSTKLSIGFIRACEQTATYFATTTGNIISTVLPKFFLDFPELVQSTQKERNKPETIHEPFLIQLPFDERFGEYKTIIRESFARGSSILFITPTVEEAKRSFETLSKGIEDFAFTTIGLSQKKLKETFIKCHKEKHPILLVTTSSYGAFDRTDLNTIIIERENSRSYKTLSRPYIDTKTFFEILARETGKTLILGDSVLSIKSLWLEKQGKFAELSPLKWKTRFDAAVNLIDMKAPAKLTEEELVKFRIFSRELKELIERALNEKKKIFLFGTRRGLASSTICNDCGDLLACSNCGAPLVLHEAKERFYLCHACGAKRTAETRCDKCTSWNLNPLGIGIDKISSEVKNLFPEANVYILDKDKASTAPKALSIVSKFMNDEQGVLIGTELALLYLEKIPYVGVVSLDSLFSIPDFNINERIFYLVNRILEKCESLAIIQTRNIGREILSMSSKGDILEYYRKDIQERNELQYPPISIFIKVSTEGTPSELEKKSVYLEQTFREFNPDFMKSKGMKSGKINLSMILRLKRDMWPNRNLVDKLLLLSSDFLIKVDPISII